MRSLSRRVLRLLILPAVLAPAWAGTPEETLKTAFDAYCKENRSYWGCEEIVALEGTRTATPGQQWLALDAYCAPDPTYIGPLDRFCEQFSSVKAATMPLVLAYDHRARRWNPMFRLARARNDEKKDRSASRIDKDISGVPTVHLKRSEELVVIVDRTNPLLFSLDVTASTESTIDEVETIQTLIDLVTANLGTLLRVSRTTVVTEPNGAVTPLIKTETVGLPELITKLQQQAALVECYAAETVQHDYARVAFLQAIEFDQSATYGPELACLKQTGAFTLDGLRAALRTLNQDYLDLVSGSFLCYNTLRAAEASLKDGKLETYRRESVTFHANREIELCGASADRLMPALDRRFAAIDAGTRPADKQKLLDEARAKYLGEIQAWLVYAAAEAPALEAAKALLDQRVTIHLALANLKAFERQLDRHLIRPAINQVRHTEDVERRLFLMKESTPTRWDRIQTHEISVTGDTKQLDVVSSALESPVKTSYKVDSATRALWGIGVALTYTPLSNPQFGAATDPENPNRQVIVVQKEDSRAGDFALMFDYQIVRRFCPQCPRPLKSIGIEFGAGLDPDKPALFFGIDGRFGRWVRMAAGATTQQVTTLASGQAVGDVVQSASDILERNTFKTDYYVSLSFRMESIRIKGE